MGPNSLSDSQYSQPVFILWPFKTYLETRMALWLV